MGKAFVVAEVEIGFGAVVGNENLAVLEGRHGARVHVEVRIELHQVDFQATALQQAANGGRRQPFPERRHDSPGHKDVLCRHRFLTLNCFGILCRLGCTSNYARNGGAWLGGFLGTFAACLCKRLGTLRFRRTRLKRPSSNSPAGWRPLDVTGHVKVQGYKSRSSDVAASRSVCGNVR